MKTKGKRRLIVLGCLALVGGLLAWWFWPRWPKVSFVEFRGSVAERVAVFALENDTGGWFNYDTYVDGRDAILAFRIRQGTDWVRLDPREVGSRVGWPILVAHLGAGRVEIPVKLVAPDGTAIAGPFQIGVFVRSGNVGERWKTAQTLSRWLPARAVNAYVDAHSSVVWSEVVTP